MRTIAIAATFFSSLALADTSDAFIASKARSYGVDPALILAIVKVESNGKSRAVGQGYKPNRESYGLMQLLPSTARLMGFSGSLNTLMKPDVNLRYGIKYVQYLETKYESKSDVVAAFNAGFVYRCKKGYVPSMRRRCRIGEYVNEPYVRKVMKWYNSYRVQQI